MVEYFTLFNLEGLALKEVNKAGPPTKPNEVGLAGKRRNKDTVEFWNKNFKTEIVDLISTIWGVSSAGRAPALQAGGHRFDPGTLHQAIKNYELQITNA